MKIISSVFLSLIALISINSCSDTDNSPSGTLTVNLVNGSTNEPLPNIEGAIWGVSFHHDNPFNTDNDGSYLTLKDGKLKVNLAETKDKIKVIELSGPLSSVLDPNNAFSRKYYTQGNLYFSPSAGIEQTQVYYTKSKIKCIVNVTKPENVGKRFYIDLNLPSDQKIPLNTIDGDGHLILSLTLGQQIIYIDAIGNYNNEIKWILNETLPFTDTTIYCNEGETKDLIINL